MTIDPAAVLALISNLTTQVSLLQQENEQLRSALAEQKPTGAPPA